MIRSRGKSRGISKPLPKTTLTLPATFTARWNPSFTIYEQGRNYTTNFDITTLKPSGTTAYVAKTGNDTTGMARLAIHIAQLQKPMQ